MKIIFDNNLSMLWKLLKTFALLPCNLTSGKEIFEKNYFMSPVLSGDSHVLYLNAIWFKHCIKYARMQLSKNPYSRKFHAVKVVQYGLEREVDLEPAQTSIT